MCNPAAGGVDESASVTRPEVGDVDHLPRNIPGEEGGMRRIMEATRAVSAAGTSKVAAAPRRGATAG
jgi:hypothetical protein